MNSEHKKTLFSGILIIPGILVFLWGILFSAPRDSLAPFALCTGGVVLFFGSLIGIFTSKRNARLIETLRNEAETIILPHEDYIKNELIETNLKSNLTWLATAVIGASVFAGIFTVAVGDSSIFWLVPVTGGVTLLFLTVNFLGILVNNEGVLLSKNVVFNGTTHFIQDEDGYSRKLEKLYLERKEITTLVIHYSYPGKNGRTQMVVNIPLAEEHESLLPEIETLWERKIQ